MREIPALQLSIKELAASLVRLCTEKNVTFGTAESCTGGLIGAAVTDVPGASAVFWGGVVSYDNRVKERVLGVRGETLATVGAVSEETACQMARGARSVLGTNFAVAVTGIAGPGGGTPEKPVGLVYIATSDAAGGIVCRRNVFDGDRTAVRLQTVETALKMLLSAVENSRDM